MSSYGYSPSYFYFANEGTQSQYEYYSDTSNRGYGKIVFPYVYDSGSYNLGAMRTTTPPPIIITIYRGEGIESINGDYNSEQKEFSVIIGSTLDLNITLKEGYSNSKLEYLSGDQNDWEYYSDTFLRIISIF